MLYSPRGEGRPGIIQVKQPLEEELRTFAQHEKTSREDILKDYNETKTTMEQW